MAKVVDYKIIISNKLPYLQEDVRSQINLGWQPIGVLVTYINEACPDPNERHIFVRELVKFDE